jgi:uncharacterized protein YoxC
MQNIDTRTIELALFALVALALLVQAIVLLATFLAMRKAAKVVSQKLEEMRASIAPFAETGSNLFTKLAPRIDSTSENLAAISQTLRAATADLQSVTGDVVARAKVQASRVDTMVGKLLDGVDRAGGVMADCINKPLRQINALLASVKAIIDSLRTSVPASSGSRTNHAPGDGEMFL